MLPKPYNPKPTPEFGGENMGCSRKQLKYFPAIASLCRSEDENGPSSKHRNSFYGIFSSNMQSKKKITLGS